MTSDLEMHSSAESLLGFKLDKKNFMKKGIKGSKLGHSQSTDKIHDFI